MAYRCQVCNKGIAHGNRVSHSNRHTRRVWRPNIQRVRARVDGQVRHLYVCTSCLRSGRVDRNV